MQMLGAPRLRVDKRLGGVPRYSVVFNDYDTDLMQVPDEFLKCVVFLAWKDGWAGTGFIIGVNWEDNSRSHIYVVTAKHVITNIKNDGETKVCLRLNFSDKPADLLATEISDWRLHPDADIAIFPVVLPPNTDHLNLPIRTFVITESLIRDRHLSVGDEIFLTGLLWQHPGSEKNIPVVRMGNIAAMPGELIETEHGKMTGYLMEARSLGGFSGSPVFVNLGGHRLSEGDFSFSLPEFYLMGVAYGHWDAEKHDREGENVNLGIAIITPASCIMDLIEGSELKAMREKTEKESKAPGAPCQESLR